MRILNSCNGLILFCISRSDNEDICVFRVYNSTTKKDKMLPNQPCRFKNQSIFGARLAFDPLVSLHYKVVCFITPHRSDVFDKNWSLEIYSSETDTWRSGPRINLSPWDVRFHCGVYCSNFIHWIGDHFSLHFDTKSESLTRREMPRKPQRYGITSRYFGQSGGHLYLIQIRNPCSKKFNVLKLEKDTFTWTVKYRIHLNHLINTFPEISWKTNSSCGVISKNPVFAEYAISILSVVNGEKENACALVLNTPGKGISYSLKHKKSKVLLEFPFQIVEPLHFNCVSSDCVNGYQYVESLYPL